MIRPLAFLAVAAVAAVCLIPVLATGQSKDSAGKDRVFELRTYYTLPGRLDALNKRFRDHTCGLFKKHGMELIGFWTPADEKDGKSNKLIYILAHQSREAAAASWKGFRDDPEWAKARDASEADGKIVEKVEFVFLNPTEYSLIK